MKEIPRCRMGGAAGVNAGVSSDHRQRTSFSTQLLRQLPVIGILRGLERRNLEPLIEATIRGGLTNLEIAMNTKDALEQIAGASAVAQGKMNIGAGTVLDEAMLERALDAGATFIVTPVVVAPVLQRCVELGVPVFPGAFSPTEINRAWDLGATMVKIFPAEVLGPGYIKSLHAPFPDLKLMPTGGVDLKSLVAYRRAGAAGCGIGTPLFNKDRIQGQDWAWIQTQARLFRERWINNC